MTAEQLYLLDRERRREHLDRKEEEAERDRKAQGDDYVPYQTLVPDEVPKTNKELLEEREGHEVIDFHHTK